MCIDCKISRILLTSSFESGSKSNKKTYSDAWNRKKLFGDDLLVLSRGWKSEWSERMKERMKNERMKNERMKGLSKRCWRRKKVDGWSDLMKESFSENCILSSSSLWSFLFSLFDVDEPTKHPTSSPSFLHEFFFSVSHEPFSMLKTETCLTVTR